MTSSAFSVLQSDIQNELSAVARQQVETNSWLMNAIQTVGKSTEAVVSTFLGVSPAKLEGIIEPLFVKLYDMSEYADSFETVKASPKMVNKIGAALTGSIGGWFGFVELAPDLVASTTLIFNTIIKVSREHGFDPTDDEIRRECLAVFCSGGPDKVDDAASSSFISTRAIINGSSVSALISRVSSEFARRLLTKMGTQAVPILGAVSGAVVNIAFINHYETLADSHFRMLKLSKSHPGLDLRTAYLEALKAVRADQKMRSEAPQRLA